MYCNNSAFGLLEDGEIEEVDLQIKEILTRMDAAKPVADKESTPPFMNFLPDVYVQCDVCKGERYNRETRQVKYKGKSLA